MAEKITLPMFVAAIDRLKAWDNKIKVDMGSMPPGITVNLNTDSDKGPFIKDMSAALYAVAQHTEIPMFAEIKTVRAAEGRGFNVQITFRGNTLHERQGIKQMAELMADHEVNFPGASTYRSKSAAG